VTDNATWGVFPGMYRIGIANANGDGTGAPPTGRAWWFRWTWH